MIENVRVGRRIAVEVSAGLLKLQKMLLRMRPKDYLIRHWERVHPFQREFGLRFEVLNRAEDPLRPFGMSGLRVLRAARISDDRHSLASFASVAPAAVTLSYEPPSGPGGERFPSCLAL